MADFCGDFAFGAKIFADADLLTIFKGGFVADITAIPITRL
ncbi:hypothetical protein ACPDXT_001796 [Vibrio cholerae]